MPDNAPVNSTWDLGNLIRAARLEQDMTRDELASATGLSPKFISQVEAGKPTAQIGKVIFLLNELGIRLFSQSSMAIANETVIKASQRRRSSRGS